MSFENRIFTEIKENFNLSNEEAEVSLLLLQLRAENLDISFEDYIKTYHPKWLAEKDNSLNDEYKGYVQFLFDDARALIRCGKKADFSTFIHENAHVFRRQLAGELKEKAEKLFNVQNGLWSEAQEEAFAIGFEEYIRYRLALTEEHKDVFEKGSLFMQRTYNGLDRIIELNPEIIEIYDQMFTESRFHFNQNEFEKAVQIIHTQSLDQFKSSHVYLGMTPPIYQELGFERLPVMMNASHLKTVMQDWGSDRNANYHGLTPDLIAQIPQAIKKPVLIMQSQHKNNSEDIIAVVELKDKNGNPIIIPLSPNKKGYINNIQVDINFAKTIYGKENFNIFLKKALEENRILYLNEKSQVFAIPRVQFPSNQSSQLMYDNIARYKDIVKQTYPNFGKLYQKVYHGSPYDFDEFNSAYIGTGEGASGWGYGFYFSEDKADAADYARKLEYEDGDGRVYTVSIPSTRHFLDISRDMYLENQSKEVQRSLKRLNKVLKDTNIGESLSSHANTFFHQLQEEFNTEYRACEYLKKAGIKGITHAEFGNRHFIVFDDENIKISKKQHLKNIRILYQKSAYYSSGQLEFDFLNDPEKKSVENAIENTPKNIILTQEDKKPLKEVKSIRENCLNLLNTKKDYEFTEEDKKLLSQYEGGGGTSEKNRSTSGVLYEFYTPNSLVTKVWELVDAYAPNAKTVLEPAGGSGRFVAGRDKNKCTLIEVDSTSSRIASILYPNVTVKNQAFQQLFFENKIVHKKEYTGDKFDIVIGNPPYGEYSGFYKGLGEGKKHSRYEQYFVERGLDTLKENGILAFVLPSSFLRSGENEGKRLIAEKGKLIDAWRLPNEMFNTTDVGTDIVIFKKEKGNVAEYCFDYFFEKNKNHILGEEIETQSRFGMEKKIIPFSGENINEILQKIKPINISSEINKTFTYNLFAFDKQDYVKTQKQIKATLDRQKPKLNSETPNLKKELLSYTAFAQKYNKEIDLQEIPIWKNTDYEGKIPIRLLTDEQKKFLIQSQNYIQLDNSNYMHIVNYTKGNVYEKLDNLEKKKESLNNLIYQKQKEILTAVIPKKIPFEKMDIPVQSAFAQEFIIGIDKNGESYNLQEGFIKWATNEDQQYILNENHTSRHWLDYEISPLNAEDFPPEISWYDIISFLSAEPVRARTAYTQEYKKAAQLEAQNKRIQRRETAEKLFTKYLNEGLNNKQKEFLNSEWNKRFNSYVNPDYSKLPLFIDGMNNFKDGIPFKLYDQQIKGISFLSNKGNGLLAYDVGVGKTACGIVATVNQIQSGRASRPLICVPKSVYSKWFNDIKELFPNIKINDLGNFNEENLKPFQTENHGLNIERGSVSLCTLEALQNITFHPETINIDLAADLMDARGNLTGDARIQAKDKERIMNILGVAASVKDNYVYWEDTGFDHITVDEAHRFKNLFTMPHSRPENADNSKAANEFDGIGSGVPSKRAQKLFAITQEIQRKNNGNGVYLLTATPFTNSPTEVYSMLSYIARQKLKDLHLYNLSMFMTEFAETKTEWAVKPNGEIQPKQVMKNFRNLHNLQNLLTEYIDKVDADEAGVKRPHKFTHIVKLEHNDVQKKIIAAETKRIENNNSKEDPGAVLVAMNNMRMALLSPALVYQSDYDFPIPQADKIVESSPKLTFVCNSIIESYKKEPQGGQIMYMPRGVNEFQHIEKYFIEHGIPKEAIALVNSSISNFKKDEITEKFNDKNEKLKIIIGSETISEGVDLNGNSFALYNCMLGWNPTESVQVEGRIWRQGNKQGNVHITYPLITDSIDSLMYQKHDEKSSRINDLWSYKGDKLNVEDIHPEELKFDLIKDPEKKASLLIERKTSD